MKANNFPKLSGQGRSGLYRLRKNPSLKGAAFQAVRKCSETNSASAAEGCFRLEPALFPQPV